MAPAGEETGDGSPERRRAAGAGAGKEEAAGSGEEAVGSGEEAAVGLGEEEDRVWLGTRFCLLARAFASNRCMTRGSLDEKVARRATQPVQATCPSWIA
jgi:hypothetical protein